MLRHLWKLVSLSSLFLFVSCSGHEIPTPTATPLPGTPTVPATITPTPTHLVSLISSFPPIQSTLPLPTEESEPQKSPDLERELAFFEQAYQHIVQERVWGDELQAVIIFGEELLLRFPELRQDTSFLMHLAYLQAQDSAFPERHRAKTFYEGLEIALNEEQIRLTELATWLEPYGFRIADQFDALNIFGDGQPAQVLHIEQIWLFQPFLLPTDSVVIVLSGTQLHDYRLTPLRETWLAYNLTSGGGEEVIDVADRNGNGQPEIASVVNVRGHATCRTELGLFEWQGSQDAGLFVNVAPLFEFWSGYFDYDCESVWHFDSLQPDGSQPVIRRTVYQNQSGEECVGFQIDQIYTWDGSQYVFSNSQHGSYDVSQPDKCRIGWAYYAPAELAIPVMEPVQDHWLPEFNKWGVASQDFLLFRLAISNALVGNTTTAKTILEELIAQPPTPQYNLISRLATAFLANYESQADLYVACSAVIETAQADLDANPRSADYEGMEVDRLEALWGFFDGSWYVYISLDVLCNRIETFNVSVAQLVATNTEELETWFEAHHIPLFVVAQYDFSGDGEADWLVSAQRGASWELFILVREANTIVLVPIPFSSSPTAPSVFHFEIFNPSSDSGIAYLTQVGERLNVFQIDQLEVNILLGEFGVASYMLAFSDSEAEIIVEETADVQTVYTWDGESKTFEGPVWTSPAYERAKAIQESMHTLLVLGDAPRAILLLETLLDDDIIEQEPDDNIKPRLLYLLGLAYELVRREEDSVRVYEELIQTYPENPYAEIANFKLEPIAP
jgi:hypothetical protein